MKNQSDLAEAWVSIPSEAQRRAQIPPGVPASGYDYGFLPAMGRLLSVHKEIGPVFGRLFWTVMFEPGHLNRQEREMVAAVAAAAQDCHY